MVSPSSRPWFSYAVGLVILLTGSTVSRAEAKRANRFTGPWDLGGLRQVPKVTTIQQAGTLTSLYYEGEPYQQRPTRIFAYLARPATTAGRLPAMVLVHGGGGTAFKEWAELWAKRCYVALAMDLAGRGPDRQRLPDGSPDQDDKARFDGRLITGQNPASSTAAAHALLELITQNAA